MAITNLKELRRAIGEAGLYDVLYATDVLQLISNFEASVRTRIDSIKPVKIAEFEGHLDDDWGRICELRRLLGEAEGQEGEG